MAWHRHTSLMSFTIQQSRSFEGVCVPLLIMNCLFPVHDSQPTATEFFQSPLYGSGTIFRSISHLLRHFPSSALAWKHTSSNSVTRNYCCIREVTLSFMDTLIALTYLPEGMFRRFDIIPACDRQTDRRTATTYSAVRAIADAATLITRSAHR